MNRKLLAALLVLILAPCLYAKNNRHGGRGNTSTGGLNITAVALPDGTVGIAYSQTLGATGGTAPYTWAITGCSGATGCLPPPLTLGAGTGTISGTPTAAGLYSFTVTVTDSAAHTYSYATAITIAQSGGTTIFQWTGQDNNLSAWDYVGYPSNTTVSAAVTHGTPYSIQDHFVICGDSTNPACGAAHQDQSLYLVKYFRSANGFPSGLTHFFVRGDVYIQASDSTVGRKLYFLTGHYPDGTHAYDLILAGNTLVPGHVGLSFTGNWLFSAVGFNSYGIYGIDTLDFNTWYTIQIEIQLDTGNLLNGILRVWVNGVQKYSATNLQFRGLLSMIPIDSVQAGFQADRTNYDSVDENRYWTNVAVGTAYIGP